MYIYIYKCTSVFVVTHFRISGNIYIYICIYMYICIYIYMSHGFLYISYIFPLFLSSRLLRKARGAVFPRILTHAIFLSSLELTSVFAALLATRPKGYPSTLGVTRLSNRNFTGNCLITV